MHNTYVFSVSFYTNKLVFNRNEHLWSDDQQKIHDLIKSLNENGLGYRRISHYLNEREIKTSKGNSWKNNNVHSVLKRNKEREEYRKNNQTALLIKIKKKFKDLMKFIENKMEIMANIIKKICNPI